MKKHKRHRYPGKTAGIPLTMIARMMHCSYSTAKRLIRVREGELGRRLEAEDLGSFLHWYHELRLSRELERNLARNPYW